MKLIFDATEVFLNQEKQKKKDLKKLINREFNKLL